MNPSPPPTTAVPEQPAQRKLQPVSPHVKVMAGMMGGFAEAAALQPLDVTKTRLQLDNTGKYRGMVNCARTIVAEEGARALYKGLTPFITHLTLKYALRFGSFAWFQGQTQAVLGVGARADFLVRLRRAGITPHPLAHACMNAPRMPCCCRDARAGGPERGAGGGCDHCDAV